MGIPSEGSLSTTAGVVSRFGVIPYGLAASHLAGQTDAAINPGNSGGPVVQGGLVVGVAFQVVRSEQNIAFFIPSPVVRHFLDDLADGHYAGFPDIPARFTELESPALRRERGLPADRSGVIVDAIQTGSNLKGCSRPATSSCSSRASASRTTGRLPPRHALAVHPPPRHEIARPAGSIFEVWRDGKATTVQWSASRYPFWDRLRKSRGTPRYLVFGGLVFVPVTLDYLTTAKPPVDRREAVYRALGKLVWGDEKDADRELVLFAKVLRDPVNDGVSDGTPSIVQRVNGQPVRDLADLARILDASHAKRDVFELGLHGGLMEAIDHEKATTSARGVFASHGIGNDRSLCRRSRASALSSSACSRPRAPGERAAGRDAAAGPAGRRGPGHRGRRPSWRRDPDLAAPWGHRSHGRGR